MTEFIVAIFIACIPGPECRITQIMLPDETTCQLFLAAQARALAEVPGIVLVRMECVPVSMPAQTDG